MGFFEALTEALAASLTDKVEPSQKPEYNETAMFRAFTRDRF